MITYKEFQQALEIINSYERQIEDNYNKISKEISKMHKFAGVTKETQILRIEHIAVRTLNCLSVAGFHGSKYKIKDLSGLKISDLKLLRRCGNKTIQEIKDICFYAGVILNP